MRRTLAVGRGRTVRLRYRFDNLQPTVTGLWLARPVGGDGQSVQAYSLAVEGAVSRSDGDELVYVELEPGGAVAAAARRILDERAAGDDPVARARAFFDELVEGDYRYVYPPPERGAAAMLRERRGDCGEFSSLFAAWCRSSGIPARIVYGAWAWGRYDAHAWNDVLGRRRRLGAGRREPRLASWLRAIALAALVVGVVAYLGAAVTLHARSARAPGTRRQRRSPPPARRAGSG